MCQESRQTDEWLPSKTIRCHIRLHIRRKISQRIAYILLVNLGIQQNYSETFDHEKQLVCECRSLLLIFQDPIISTSFMN